jgi:hypothetical protein
MRASRSCVTLAMASMVPAGAVTEERLGADVAQPGVVQDARQGAGVLEVSAVLGQERPHSSVHLVAPVVLGLVGVDADERHDVVVVLDHQPATRSERSGHPPDHVEPSREVEQDVPSVHEVELLGRDVVTGDVVSLDLDGGIELARRPADVDIGGDDPSARADAAGQPVGDGDPTRPDLPAPPSLIDAPCIEVAEGHGIEESAQGIHAHSGVLVGECVAVAAHCEILAFALVRAARSRLCTSRSLS